MLTILIIIFSFIVIGVAVFFGKKLVNYKSIAQDAKEENIFEELKDLRSLKIDIVPAKELYSYFFGNMLFFIGFYIGICIVGGFIEWHGFIQPLAEAGMFFLFYFLLFVFGFWQYAFFRKAIIPNLKYGALIHKRMQKFIQLNAAFMALPVWISATFGFMVPGFFAGMFLVMFVSAAIINFELQRAGVPDLITGLQNLKNNKQCAKL